MEEKLHCAARFEIVAQLGTLAREGDWIAMGKFARPLVPALQLKLSPETVEEDEVFQPPGVVATELLKPTAGTGWGGSEKVMRSFKQKRHLSTEDMLVVHGRDRVGQGVNPGTIDPAPIGQAFEADQEWISGKGGGRRVGRVSEAQGAKGQDLPKALSCGRKKVSKRIRGRAEVADPAARGQRGGVQQNSAGARERHSKSILSSRFQFPEEG